MLLLKAHLLVAALCAFAFANAYVRKAEDVYEGQYEDERLPARVAIDYAGDA